jgi:hypothetical protein
MRFPSSEDAPSSYIDSSRLRWDSLHVLQLQCTLQRQPVFAEAGGLFHLATSSELIRAFMGGFQSTKEHSVVATKSSQLLVLCQMDKLPYGRNEASPKYMQALRLIDEPLNLLAGFRRVEKATSYRQKAVRRDESDRDTFIHSSD